MPDPEETEREALAKIIGAGECTECYGRGTRFGPGIPCYHCQGTGQKLLKADAVLDAMLAARRLSESEIRRDLIEQIKDARAVWTERKVNGKRTPIQAGDIVVNMLGQIITGEADRG